ncbi:MAG: hypothetical protein RR100_12560 [Comamonas sp.]
MQFADQCQLRPTPQGVLHWLTPDSHGTERQLLQWLLLRGTTTPLQLPLLSQALQLEPSVLSRALFRLVRTEAVDVEAAASASQEPWRAQGLAALQDDLGQWAQPGQCLLLSTADGLALASTGWNAYTCRALAARNHAAPPVGVQCSRLALGGHVLQLSWTDALDLQHPALLRLAFRLLRAPFRTAAQPADRSHAAHHPAPVPHC